MGAGASRRALGLRTAGAQSTRSLKISGCKRWRPKDLWVRAHAAPVLTHSLCTVGSLFETFHSLCLGLSTYFANWCKSIARYFWGYPNTILGHSSTFSIMYFLIFFSYNRNHIHRNHENCTKNNILWFDRPGCMGRTVFVWLVLSCSANYQCTKHFVTNYTTLHILNVI